MSGREIILGFDMALSNSAAISIDGKILSPTSSKNSPSRPSAMMKIIDSLLEEVDASPDQISALTMNIGPGSFTGIRVGIATAKGLAIPFNTPLIPFTSFEMIASINPDYKDGGIIINAGGGYFYFQASCESKNGNISSRASLLKTDEVIAKVDKLSTILLYGNKLDETGRNFKEMFPDKNIISENKDMAALLCVAAGVAFKNNEFLKPVELKPFYVKPSYVNL